MDTIWLKLKPKEFHEIWDFIHDITREYSHNYFRAPLHKLRQHSIWSKRRMLLYFPLFIFLLTPIALSEAKPNTFLVQTQHKDEDVQIGMNRARRAHKVCDMFPQDILVHQYSHMFLSDPGIPGVRSMGPSVSKSVSPRPCWKRYASYASYASYSSNMQVMQVICK